MQIEIWIKNVIDNTEIIFKPLSRIKDNETFNPATFMANIKKYSLLYSYRIIATSITTSRTLILPSWLISALYE